MALAFGLSGFLLEATGYAVELGGAQSSSTFFWMRFLDVSIPAAAALIAIFSVASFKITEEKAYEIRSALEKRRGVKTAPETAVQS
jgi:GPH family glycoside/pentoside/hexuronide:cation symporter